MSDTNKVKVVAEYDGWVFSKSAADGRQLYAKGDSTQWLKYFQYHTSIEALYPVAGKVVKELVRLEMGGQELDIAIEIHRGWNAIMDANNTFDIAQLFEAVYQGILIINSKNK